MKKAGLWIALIGGVSVMAIAIVVTQAQAADKDGIKAIVDLIKAGKNTEAKATAKAYAAKTKDDLEELMAGFKSSKKGGLVEPGIEQTFVKFGRDVQSAANLSKAELQDMGAITAAIALVTEAIPAPKSTKGTPADWSKWAKELADNGQALQNAIKSKSPADVKTAASKINATCNSCHTAFK